MSKFKVSVPGRMFLCGEHVIMYGKQVVAASLDLRTTLKFIELINNPRNIIKIEFPDVDLSLNLSLELIQNFFFTNDFHFVFQNPFLLLKRVQYFININGLWTTYEQRYSLQTFLFLFLYIAYEEELDIKSFHVHLTTQLPINAGFGSSTSFAVCVAACFLHWSRLQEGAHFDFDNDELQIIIFYVTICEKDIHNYGFIDPTVCAYGQVLKARYITPKNYDEEHLGMPRMKILLIDSGIRQNNYEQVMAQMAQRKQSNPDGCDYFLRIIDKLTELIFVRLVIITFSQIFNNLQRFYHSYALLKKFIRVSQNIFHRAGFSHSTLDTIFSIAKNHGFEGRLTGFHGYAYIILPPNAPRENIRNLLMHLEMSGFTVRMTSVSCNGLELDEV